MVRNAHVWATTQIRIPDRHSVEKARCDCEQGQRSAYCERQPRSRAVVAFSVCFGAAGASSAQLLLHSTLDDAAAVSSPAVGTGSGSSVVTTPADDFVLGQVGGGIRIDAPNESARFAQTDGATVNLDPSVGTLAIRFRSHSFSDDGVRHPLVSTGAWPSPNSLHIEKSNAPNNNAFAITYFDALGSHQVDSVPAAEVNWTAGEWVELRVTWDFGVAAGVQRLHVYIDDREVSIASPTTGPVLMGPSEPARDDLRRGARRRHALRGWHSR